MVPSILDPPVTKNTRILYRVQYLHYSKVPIIDVSNIIAFNTRTQARKTEATVYGA